VKFQTDLTIGNVATTAILQDCSERQAANTHIDVAGAQWDVGAARQWCASSACKGKGTTATSPREQLVETTVSHTYSLSHP
jgi:hypothetical protein